MWLGDPLYYMTVIPGLIIATRAQIRVLGAIIDGSKVLARSGASGAEAASRLLRDVDLDEELIARVSGPLSVFTIRSRVRLSPAAAPLGVWQLAFLTTSWAHCSRPVVIRVDRTDDSGHGGLGDPRFAGSCPASGLLVGILSLLLAIAHCGKRASAR